MKQKIVMNIGGKFRRAKLEGRDHLVVPCVMLVTGVINGSAGPLFYPEDEIEKSTSKWNGMPIVVDHPTDGEDFISARSAEVFNSRKVGVILETEFDDKLRTECWFDEERTKAVDKRVHNAILKKKKMEVSTGLELDNVEKEGEYEGTKYSGITSNYRPDHLAILPDKIGAASIAMGAGLFANVSKEPESIQEVWNRSIEYALKPLGITITANEMSFSDISRSLSDLLSSQYGEPGKYWQGWVCDVYDEYVIFCLGNGETWRQDYTNKDDVVALSGDAVQVRRTVSYTANVSNSGSSKMAFDKKKFVDNLIANGDAAESDRDKLMGVDDTVLALWEVSNPKPPKIKKVTDVEPESAPTPVVNKKAETEEEVIAKLPKRLRKILINHEKAETAHREQLIEVITNQKLKKPFKKEWLEGQETEVLENMVQMIPVANTSPDDDDDDDDDDEGGSIVFGRAAGGNYVGNAGGGSKVVKEDEDKDVLEPVGVVNFADPRKKR